VLELFGRAAGDADELNRWKATQDRKDGEMGETPRPDDGNSNRVRHVRPSSLPRGKRMWVDGCLTAKAELRVAMMPGLLQLWKMVKWFDQLPTRLPNPILILNTESGSMRYMYGKANNRPPLCLNVVAVSSASLKASGSPVA
jgi:hypothetical protein